MKVALVHNPDAGDGGLSRRELLALLRRHGWTARPVNPDRLPRDLDPAGETVVVAGGDGSIKRVARRLAGTLHRLALLPTGTANNIAHGLGIEGSPESIVSGWKSAVPIAVDLGVASGPWGRLPFIESAGVGLIGRAIAIMEGVHRVTKDEPAEREDRLHRDRCVMLTVAHELTPITLHVAAEGGRPKKGRFLLCEMLNIRRGGPGIQLSGGADPSDGRLDLVMVTSGGRRRLVRLLERSLAVREPAPLPRPRRVTRVRLRLGVGDFRVDDEVVWPPKRRRGPRRPVSITVEIAPGALWCLLPGKRTDRGR